MKTFYSIACAALLTAGLSACTSGQSGTLPQQTTLSNAQLMNKIKGGWAGQTIGCTYGGPTEFRFCGTMIQDYTPIDWPEGYIKWYYDNVPGLYDDLYMDLTFVNVFDRLGIDAPADSLAIAFAKAPYPLWHANQAARYNILNGIMPPASGHWLNSPHADDLDFQIEADFAGLMAPGMPNSAADITDRVGHIMNYGDGWYGGVYVAAMYSLAFVSDDIEFIVTEALKTIPAESKYYKCMSDVIRFYKQYPDDWKRTWLECERTWSSDIGCPDGVFAPFNIDATINSAYIIIGLLYGQGDFFKTIDIATRCGRDSDCNPASAGGILGTMLGYDKIPEYWMKNLREVEDRNFAYTDISLNRAYQMSFDQALQVIERNGGTIGDSTVTIQCQTPVAVRYEQSFEGHFPTARFGINRSIKDNPSVDFDGIGIVVRHPAINGAPADYVAEIEVLLDGNLDQTVLLPVDFHDRKHEMYWKYQLPKGKHTLTFNWKNPQPGIDIWFYDAISYSDAPAPVSHQ